MILSILLFIIFSSAQQHSLHWSLEAINVRTIWEKFGLLGKGITIALIDDRVDEKHSDLVDAYDPQLFVDLEPKNGTNQLRSNRHLFYDSHATRCAGQIAGKHSLDSCSFGIAPRARLANIRVLSDSRMDSTMEARAITAHLDQIDVYNCSWGPTDDGRTVDGPDELVLMSFMKGLKKGRNGLGSLYVFASGNGGLAGDHCNFDGYANAPFIVSIGAVDREGKSPSYMEPCPAMLAVAPSSNLQDRIQTTEAGGGCTGDHGGTSAAAPIATSIIALMLEARPELTWPQVHRIIAQGAVPFALEEQSWTRNAAGRWFSDLFGFGRLDAHRLITLAMNYRQDQAREVIRKSNYSTSQEVGIDASLTTVERVGIQVHTRNMVKRGDTEIWLTSPQGTKSRIVGRRPRDRSNQPFRGWLFTSNTFWGEEASGVWRVLVQGAQLIKWRLIIFGLEQMMLMSKKSIFDEDNVDWTDEFLKLAKG